MFASLGVWFWRLCVNLGLWGACFLSYILY